MQIAIFSRLAQPLSSISLAISKWLYSFPLYFFFWIYICLHYTISRARIKILVVIVLLLFYEKQK